MSRCSPEQKKDAVLRVHAGEKLSALGRELGVSREIIRQWVKNYARDGDAGLMPKSTRPKTSPKKTPAELENLVIKLKRSNPQWDAPRISKELKRMGHKLSAKTVNKILYKNGLRTMVLRLRR